MLALSCCIGSTDAAIQKNLTIRENAVVVPNLDKAVKEDVQKEFVAGTATSSARLSVVNVDDHACFNTKQKLNAQLEHNNFAVVRNPDGTLTAAIRGSHGGKGTGTLNGDAIWEASFVGGSPPPWNAYLGYHTALGGYANPAFYYDISLLPETCDNSEREC